ncbi:MAG: chromosome segregation protein SMC, partial [Acidobacteriota bacterium]|nr:chromosome segregation protein SMC [Acidobacteriota bacterium]
GLLVLQLKAELETAGAAREFKEKEIEAAAGSVRSRRDELDAMNQSLTAAQVKLSALEERMQAADADEKRVVAEAGQAREQLSRLATQSAEWDAERARLVSEADAGEAILKEAGSRERSLRDEIELRELEAQSQRASRDELAPQAEAARARMEAVRAKRSEVEIDQARAASGLEHHAGQCREELGLEPEALRAAFDAGALLTGEGLQSAEENVRELKGKIDRLGPVNMMALEELEEASGRLAFLDGQRQDLLASIQDTAATITEIDTASRRKFMDAFNAINGFFADSFRTLFGGGAGEMRFSDSDDPESGIDLVAQPPGKRLQNVLLLSGGEKALTALALLIAVFRFSPSPFCILDEVDAPLDEANVARFALMIQSMSEQTQFILITHNKRTMEACRIMYGVTMEEPGVSRLVSVRFEARELEPVAPGA